MEEQHLCELLEKLHDVILAERRAAKALSVDEMIELTDEKEQILEQVLPLVDPANSLTPRQNELVQSIYTENLHNAYFFWTALKWVRDSIDFMGNAVYPASYEENGNRVKGHCSGAIISGKI